MFAAESHASRHCIAIVAMACLCVLLGGPTYAAGAESLFIAGATYYGPGASGPGWAWTDADHFGEIRREYDRYLNAKMLANKGLDSL